MAKIKTRDFLYIGEIEGEREDVQAIMVAMSAGDPTAVEKIEAAAPPKAEAKANGKAETKPKGGKKTTVKKKTTAKKAAAPEPEPEEEEPEEEEPEEEEPEVEETEEEEEDPEEEEEEEEEPEDTQAAAPKKNGVNGKVDPDDLQGARRLREVVQYMLDKGYEDPDEIASICEDIKDEVPLLQRVANIPSRIKTAYDMLQQ